MFGGKHIQCHKLMGFKTNGESPSSLQTIRTVRDRGHDLIQTSYQTGRETTAQRGGTIYSVQAVSEGEVRTRSSVF